MLQIVIWGMAIMLVVKGLDVVHRDAVAAKTPTGGALKFAAVTFIVALAGAAFLIWSAGTQTRQFEPGPPPVTFGN